MKKVVSIFLMLMLCFPLFSQIERRVEDSAKKVDIYFDLNSCTIDSCFGGNVSSLAELSNFIKNLQSDTLATITKIVVSSSASPEGGFHYNEMLSKNRIDAICSYLKREHSISDSILFKGTYGIDWRELQQRVLQSDMKHKEGVVAIIDKVKEETWAKINPTDRFLSLVDSRNKHLMDFKYGVPYNYMLEHIYPAMRRGSVTTIYYTVILPPVVEEPEPEIVEEVVVPPVVEPQPVVEEPVAEPAVEEPKPILAIKTNLLYDIAITPSLEVEIPIGKKWSIGAQAMCGWWSSKNNTFAWQIQAADIEGRYWFNKDSEKQVLTGWFAGLFASAGFYDFQLQKDRGVQGDFYLFSGVSGGYSMPLTKNLYLEFAVGVGYVVNEYQKYTVSSGKYLIADGVRMRYQSLLPAKLEVSLGWLIFNKKGGDR